MTKGTRYALPPAGLSKTAAKWWRRLTSEYDITDSAGELLLETALRALDRAEKARYIVEMLVGPLWREIKDCVPMLVGAGYIFLDSDTADHSGYHVTATSWSARCRIIYIFE